jgi:hypothetical protein
MSCKWDDSSKVFCIKEYKTLKVGNGYSIKGRGDLAFNADPEVGGRKGYGLCIEDNMVAIHRDRYWTLPYNERVKWYYFTIEEMDEYFITDDENYKIYLRDQKINSIIND